MNTKKIVIGTILVVILILFMRCSYRFVNTRMIRAQSWDEREAAAAQIVEGMTLGEVEALEFEYSTKKQCDFDSTSLVLFGFGESDDGGPILPYYIVLFFENEDQSKMLNRIGFVDKETFFLQPCR